MILKHNILSSAILFLNDDTKNPLYCRKSRLHSNTAHLSELSFQCFLSYISVHKIQVSPGVHNEQYWYKIKRQVSWAKDDRYPNHGRHQLLSSAIHLMIPKFGNSFDDCFTTFRHGGITFPSVVQKYTKFANSQDCIFQSLQHFWTKLYNFTKLRMFFPVVLIYIPDSKVCLIKWFVCWWSAIFNIDIPVAPYFADYIFLVQYNYLQIRFTRKKLLSKNENALKTDCPQDELFSNLILFSNLYLSSKLYFLQCNFPQQ